MRFAQRLKHLRKELNLKQDDLAKACNVKLTAISKYENELIKPGFDMLSKIGLAYNINLNWLVNELGSMFLETPQRRLVKDGTNNFTVEVDDNAEVEMVTVKTDTHSLELTNDLKVEYYGVDNENYVKIYRKSGEVEYCKANTTDENLQQIIQKLQTVCHDKNQLDFIITAINALENEQALNELKALIKGIELSKNIKNN